MKQAGTAAVKTLALALCLASVPANAADQILTPDGLGRVKIGMTVRQAEKALGARLRPRDTKFGTEACWHTYRSDLDDPPISYKVWYKKIVSIQVFKPEHGEILPIATDKGIHVGDEDAKVKEAYGQSLHVRPDSQVNNESEASVMTVSTKDKSRGLVFLTIDTKVVEIRAGLSEPIQAIDDC